MPDNDARNDNIGAADGAEWDFAYHVDVGFSYDITHNVKFDMAYRFIDLGQVVSGVDPAPPVGDPGAISVDGIQAHEVKFGLRFYFGNPAW